MSTAERNQQSAFIYDGADCQRFPERFLNDYLALPMTIFFFLEIHVLLFIYLFIYDCVESSFLCEGFL